MWLEQDPTAQKQRPPSLLFPPFSLLVLLPKGAPTPDMPMPLPPPLHLLEAPSSPEDLAVPPRAPTAQECPARQEAPQNKLEAG